MRIALLAAVALVVSACSALRENQQGWREAECDQAIDTPRREACLKEVRKNQ
jgi:hypothetical protein